MRLAEAMQEFDLSMAGGVAEEATRVLYRYTLRKLLEFAGDVELASITISLLRRWREAINREDLSVYTVHRDIRQAKRFFNWCVDEGLLEHSPAARLKLPKLPRGEPPKAISELDMVRMIDVARRQVQGSPNRDTIRDYAIIRFLAETGCRVGGLVGLRFGDLELEAREATVREKGRKTRGVNFGPETVQALRAWLVLRPRGRWGEVVFTGKRGPLTPSGVYRVLQRLAKAAGVEGRYNPHSFRHALARRLLKHGADMGTVSQILGHSDIETTHRFYARWSNQELAERHREFGGLLD